MSPKKQEQRHNPAYSMYPTSPWTEAYQAAPGQWTRREQTPREPQFTEGSESQRPTHDALSDIYNRGY